jgi:hypothetical protein
LFYTINTKFNQVVDTFSRVKDAAASDGRVYVIGYPSLAAANSNCAVNVHLNNHEIIFANQLTLYINRVLSQAAAKAGAKFVDATNAFDGHRLCETDSSKVAINGLTAGDDKTFSIPLDSSVNLNVYLIGRESYHPNKLGHRLLADLIAKDTSQMSPSDSVPDLGIPNPSLLQAADIVGAPLASLPPPRKIFFSDKLTSALLLKGEHTPLLTDGLLASTDARIWIDSNQVEAGSYRASGSGKLQISFKPPPSLETGLHTIHIYAKSPAGEDVDVQQTIYLASSIDDIDGDGTNNNQEKCLLVQESKEDRDSDGQDDSCEGSIGLPPTFGKISGPGNELASARSPGLFIHHNPSFSVLGALYNIPPAQPTHKTGNLSITDRSLELKRSWVSFFANANPWLLISLVIIYIYMSLKILYGNSRSRRKSLQ